MANTQMQGPAGWPPSASNAPAGMTRTTTGLGDHGDPNTTTAAGNTPGPSGVNDHTDVNLPRLDDKPAAAPGSVVRGPDGKPVALGGGKAPIPAPTRKLAAIAYGEAGVKDVAEEIGGIAWAVANRARAWDGKTIDQLLEADPNYTYAIKDGNARYAKLMKASAETIAADPGMAAALKAATEALDDKGTDSSGGGFWWDGKDFGTNPNHAKRLAGFRYGDASHNLFKVDAVSKPVTRYWMTKDKHGNVVQGKERGKYTAVWVSTAAHGDTIFWKHDDDYLTAEGGKAYR